MDILKELSGGDRRSIGNANKVVAHVLKNPSLFAALFNGLNHEGGLIRMRAADAIEKISRSKPGLLKPYTNELIKKTAKSDQAEVRWHLAQIFSRIILTAPQKKYVIKILISYFENDNSAIVKTCSLQTLFEFSKTDAQLEKTVRRLIKKAGHSTSAALRKRASLIISS